MATIVNFEDLEIWQEARRIYKKVLVLTNRPDEKRISNSEIKSGMRRSLLWSKLLKDLAVTVGWNLLTY